MAVKKRKTKRKTVAKKKAAKRRVKSKRATPKKRATKKRVTKKKTKNKVKRNPVQSHTNFYVVKMAGKKISSYFSGAGWVQKKNAAIWHNQGTALNIAQLLADKYKTKNIGVISEKK